MAKNEKQDETGNKSKYTIEQIFGKEYAEDIEKINIDYESSAEEVKRINKRMEELSNNMKEDLKKYDKVLDDFKKLGYKKEGAKGLIGAVSYVVTKIPVIGKIIEDKETTTVTKQLDNMIILLKNYRDEFGSSLDALDEQRRSWTENRKKLIDVREKAFEKKKEIEDEIVSVRKEYEELEERYKSMDENDPEYFNVEKYLAQLEDELNKKKDELTSASISVSQLKNRKKVVDNFIKTMDVALDTGRSIYKDLETSLENLETVVQGEIGISKVLEEAGNILAAYNVAVKYSDLVAKLTVDEVSSLNKARVGIYSKQPVTEETLEYMMEKLNEIKEEKKKIAVAAWKNSEE